MVKHKAVLIALGLALWGASTVVMLKSTEPQVLSVHAQGTILNVKATIKDPTAGKIEVAFNALQDATSYKIERIVHNGPGNEIDTITVSSPAPPIYTYTDFNLTNADYAYKVTAFKAETVLGGGTSNTVTIIASTATGTPAVPGGAGAETKSAFLGTSCEATEAAAKGAATAAAQQPFTNSIYDTINSEGVKTVYRWTLSLVNLLVLFFLLVIAFSNILRLNIDTYAVQKVFTPLILGVLLANFGWLICRFFLEISTIVYHALTDAYGGGAGLFEKISINGYGFNNICAIAKGQSIGFGASLLGSFVGTAMMLVAGVLILTLYFLLIARVWVVTLLMVLSPLAFLSLGFPMTQAYFKKWWSIFFNWVFMAPASFLILVLAVKMSEISSGPSLTKYIIITGLLYFAVQVPFKMGGEWMTKWGGVVSQFKQKAYNATAKPVLGLAQKGYESQRDLLKLKTKDYATRDLKVKGKNINPIRGAVNIYGRGQEKYDKSKITAEENIKSRLDEARKTFYNNQEKSDKFASAQEKARSNSENAAKELESKQTEGTVRYYADSKVTRERSVQAEAELERVKAELETKKGEKAIEFRETDAGLAMDERLQAAKLHEKLDHAKQEAQTKDALARTQLAEIDNDAGVKAANKFLEELQNQLTLNPKNKTLIRQVKQAENGLEQARINASQNTSIAKEAIISTQDALGENEAEITRLFSKSDLGKEIDVKRAFWGLYKASREQDAKLALEAQKVLLRKQSPEQLKTIVSQLKGPDASPEDLIDGQKMVKNEVYKSNRIAQQFLVQSQNAEREVKKGLDRVVEEIVHSQLFLERIAQAKRQLDVVKIRADQNPGDVLARQEVNKAEELHNKLTTDRTTHERMMNEKYTSIEEMPEHMQDAWEVGRNNKLTLKKIDQPELDRMRNHVARVTQERARSTAQDRTAIDHINEMSGAGTDIKKPAWISAVLDKDYAAIDSLLNDKDEDFNVRDIEKINAWIDSTMLKLGSLRDPQAAALRKNFFQRSITDKMLEEAVHVMRESPTLGKVGAQLRNSINGNVPEEWRNALSSITDQRELTLVSGALSTVRGGVRENG